MPGRRFGAAAVNRLISAVRIWLPPDQQVANARCSSVAWWCGGRTRFQAVGLRLASFRVRQGAHAAWLHPRRRQASLEQLGEHHALQPAGRLQHNQGRLRARVTRSWTPSSVYGIVSSGACGSAPNATSSVCLETSMP
jgi:hypothetical protein